MNTKKWFTDAGATAFVTWLLLLPLALFLAVCLAPFKIIGVIK